MDKLCGVVIPNEFLSGTLSIYTGPTKCSLTLNCWYSQFPLFRTPPDPQESVIAGIYFRQTSEIYLCGGFSCCPYYRPGVRCNDVYARRELTVVTTLMCNFKFQFIKAVKVFFFFSQTEITRSDEILDGHLTMKEVCRIYGLYSKVNNRLLSLTRTPLVIFKENERCPTLLLSNQDCKRKKTGEKTEQSGWAESGVCLCNPSTIPRGSSQGGIGSK